MDINKPFQNHLEKNIVFIDGQNLHLGTKYNSWSVDHKKFRTYLNDRYHIKDAYYFLGFKSKDENKLYEKLQEAGFIIEFREHSEVLLGKKKGNVDSDIIFLIMEKLLLNEKFDKVYIVSGDGDYKRVVNLLVNRNRFGKMLFPNKKFASSLYKILGSEYYDYLENPNIKSKIEYRK